jgi:hypothetical protein
VTTVVDIANRSLIAAGIPKKITALTQDSTEAQTIGPIISLLRDDLIRLAPWNCVTRFNNLVYITSVPTTPENPSSGAPLWQPGIPVPPWAYEYQYPVDCIRARYIIPQYTSQAGGVPIYPPGTATGAQQVGWAGPALKFNIATDQFFGVTAAQVAVGGSGHTVGDFITLARPTYTFIQNGVSFSMNVGAPAVLQVTGVAGGAITSVVPVNQVLGEATAASGSYFSPTGASGAEGSSTGAGVGASFNLTFGSQGAQRVVLCNQEQAILCYNTQITDPNVMDTYFQDAWINLLASRLAFSLLGDTPRANALINQTNAMIMEARKADGNEDITVNDVTPDFLRARGNWGGPNWEFSPNMSFDWGSTYSPY